MANLFLNLLRGAYIARNFQAKEMSCKCGCNEVKFHWFLPIVLQAVRDNYEKSHGYAKVIIRAGYRCRTFNNKLIALWKAKKYPYEPAKNSRHLYGEAADVHVYYKSTRWGRWIKADTTDVSRVAKICGATYTKVYDTFTHIDVRGV